VVPRQGIVLAIFRIVPKVDIKFLSEFWVQTSHLCWASGCRPCDHIPVISKSGEDLSIAAVPKSDAGDTMRPDGSRTGICEAWWKQSNVNGAPARG
jgi:hypothetical protein